MIINYATKHTEAYSSTSAEALQLAWAFFLTNSVIPKSVEGQCSKSNGKAQKWCSSSERSVLVFIRHAIYFCASAAGQFRKTYFPASRDGEHRDQ